VKKNYSKNIKFKATKIVITNSVIIYNVSHQYVLIYQNAL